MKSVATITFFLLLSVVSRAQYENEPVQLEMPSRVNTVGVNLTPLVVHFLNGDPVISRWSAVYKRQTKPYRSWRFQANLENRDFYENERNSTPVDWSDSTITFLYQSRDYWNADVRIGVEWFSAFEKSSMIYGVDLLGGLWVNYDMERVRPLYFDNAVEYWVPSPFEEETVFEETITYAYFGADFSIGRKIHINEQWNMVIRWTPEVIYRWPIKEEYTDPELRSMVPSDEFHFRLRGIELYLFWVF